MAKEHWNESFESQPRTFLLAITYVDSLLRQSKYGDAQTYLEQALAAEDSSKSWVLTEGQLILLSLMKAYCNIWTKGLLRYAVRKARNAWKWLAGIDLASYDEVQVPNTQQPSESPAN